MEQIRKTKSNTKWKIYLYAVILTTILTFLTINKIFAQTDDSGMGHNLLMLILLFGFSLYIMLSKNDYSSKSIAVRLSIIFLLLTIPTTIFSSQVYTDFLNGFLTIAFIPLALSIGRYFGKQLSILNNSDILIFILMLPSVIGFFILDSSQTISQLYLETSDFSFAFIVFLPLILFYRSPVLKYSFLLLLGYISIISAKRSVILSFIFIVILLLLSNLRNFKNISSKRLIIDIIVLLVVVITTIKIYNANQVIFQIVTDRFSQLEYDNGSGRSDIYNKLLDEIEHSDFINLIFGHGYNAVTKNIFGHPAHNDFLEILYDFGLIPLLVFILIFLIIIIKDIKLFLRRKQLYVFTAASLINILTLGLMNCIITNALFVFVSMFILGISLEHTKNIINNYGAYRTFKLPQSPPLR
jgi:O-antigen ligase